MQRGALGFFMARFPLVTSRRRQVRIFAYNGDFGGGFGGSGHGGPFGGGGGGGNSGPPASPEKLVPHREDTHKEFPPALDLHPTFGFNNLKDMLWLACTCVGFLLLISNLRAPVALAVMAPLIGFVGFLESWFNRIDDSFKEDLLGDPVLRAKPRKLRMEMHDSNKELRLEMRDSFKKLGMEIKNLAKVQQWRTDVLSALVVVVATKVFLC